MTTTIILSNNDWLTVPVGVDPDHYRAEQESLLSLTVKDGVFWNEELEEFEVFVNGEYFGFGQDQDDLWRQYRLAVDDTIPFTGEYIEAEPINLDDEIEVPF